MLRQTSEPTDNYADIAPFYDLEHDQFQDDIAMYRQVVEMVGDPVVEFACGSGRILAGIDEPGRRLTGLDSSPVMLQRCRDRFAGSDRPPTLLLADMATADLPAGQFGVAIIGLNSLMHAATTEQQLATLTTAHRALDPRGLLVLDLFNPLPVLHDAADGRVRLEQTFDLATGERVSKFSSQDLDLAEQIIRTNIWYDVVAVDGAIRRYATSTTLRFLFRSELELLLQSAGFPAMQVYGSYDLDPYGSDSPRLIVFAERS